MIDLLPERVKSKFSVEDGDGCWTWRATKSNGYGRLFIGGRAWPAHRWVYEALVGLIPEGLTLDHLCRNRACVRPDHLEPVTMRENILRGESFAAVNNRKTHCKHGHEFTPENTYVATPAWRGCRTCARDARRKWKSRNRDRVNAQQRELRARKRIAA